MRPRASSILLAALATATLGCDPIPARVDAVTVSDVQLTRALLDGKEGIQGSFQLAIRAYALNESDAHVVLQEPHLWARDDMGRDIYPGYLFTSATASQDDPVVIAPGGTGTVSVTFTALRDTGYMEMPTPEASMVLGGRVNDEADNDETYQIEVAPPPPL